MSWRQSQAESGGRTDRQTYDRSQVNGWVLECGRRVGCLWGEEADDMWVA